MNEWIEWLIQCQLDKLRRLSDWMDNVTDRLNLSSDHYSTGLHSMPYFTRWFDWLINCRPGFDWNRFVISFHSIYDFDCTYTVQYSTAVQHLYVYLPLLQKSTHSFSLILKLEKGDWECSVGTFIQLNTKTSRQVESKIHLHFLPSCLLSSDILFFCSHLWKTSTLWLQVTQDFWWPYNQWVWFITLM